MQTIVFAVPEAMMGDANQLALVMGSSPAEVRSFREPNFQRDTDDDEQEPERYCVRSTLVSDDWLTALSGTFTAPDFAPDADVTAATRARDAIDYTSQAEPDRIAARVGLSVAAAIAAFNVEAG